MTDTPEPDPAPVPAPNAPTQPPRPDRLYRVAAWVAIVAGGLVIVVVVFGSGFLLGTQVGRAHDRDRGPGEHSRMFDMRPGQPPLGDMERPNFGGPPQAPEAPTAPQRPSATPTP